MTNHDSFYDFPEVMEDCSSCGGGAAVHSVYGESLCRRCFEQGNRDAAQQDPSVMDRDLAADLDEDYKNGQIW